MPDQDQLLAAALTRAERGWKIFPLHNINADGKCTCARPECQSAGKHPRTSTGFQEASTDPEVIKAWWEKWPDANLGLATGQMSGLVAIDLDVKTGGPNNWSLLMDQKGIVDTLTTITGSGGQHWLFKVPEGLRLRSTASVVARGIDTRAEGGYIVLPPSNHLSGNSYEWDQKIQPADLPTWLIELWPAYQADKGLDAMPSSVKSEAPHWVAYALEHGAPDGERNNTAIRLAGYLHSKGLPPDIIAKVMEPYAAKSQPPMNTSELSQVIQSAQRYKVTTRTPDYEDSELMPVASIPGFSATTGVYEMRWNEHHILIRADRIHEDSHYNLTAEILVKSTMAGVAAHIHQARLNFVSSTTRRSLIKELETRMPDLPWQTMIEDFVVEVLATHRKGEPTIQIAEHEQSEALRHRLYPLLLEKQATVYYGQGESGKSMFALFQAIVISAGINVPELGWLVEPGPVLYLDYETSPDEIWDRVNSICEGLHIPIPEDLYYHYMTQPLAADIESIQRDVTEKKIALIIVDSGAPASLEPETSAGATGFFHALRTLQCTALVIAHQEASGRQDRPFGSIFWRNLPRANFRFQSATQPGENSFVIGVKHTKSNNARRLRDTGYRVTFNDGEITIEPAQLLDVEVLSETLPQHVRVTHVLEQGAASYQELADATGITLNGLRPVVRRMVDSGQVHQVQGDGKTVRWGLKPLGNQAELA
jgi:hypothetical protein